MVALVAAAVLLLFLLLCAGLLLMNESEIEESGMSQHQPAVQFAS
jgi:hypothetical protein